jgi:apolipoprotein N-acyltransferase
LAFAVLAPAFLASTALTPGRAFRAWFVGGLAYNAAMYWWIWHVMKVGPALVVGAGLVLLIAFLSLFNGFLGWAFAKAHQARRARAVLLATYPLLWAGLEAARAVGEMSFPWNNLAYTLGNHTALIQSVSVWGVYGLSAALIVANMMLMRVIAPGEATGSRTPHQNGARRLALSVWIGIPILLTVHGSVRVLSAQDDAAPRLDIALVQPSIPQTKKWNEGYFNDVMAKTFRTLAGPSGTYAHVQGTDLIVFAETAVPDFLRSRPALTDSLQTLATRLDAPILMGALDIVVDRKPWSEYTFYNSAFLFNPQVDDRPRQYSKLRLVPFSEKLPFDGVFPVLNYVNLGEGDFSSGDGPRVWGDRATRWAPSICYEVIYPSFAREARAAGAKVLVNITNDGWFGRSNGPYQHANISRFRAAETGMPVARCANNGVSVFFDARGRDLGRTALMDSTVLRRSIPVPNLITPYARYGGLIDALFLSAVPLWLVLLIAFRPPRGSTLKL